MTGRRDMDELARGFAEATAKVQPPETRRTAGRLSATRLVGVVVVAASSLTLAVAVLGTRLPGPADSGPSATAAATGAGATPTPSAPTIALTAFELRATITGHCGSEGGCAYDAFLDGPGSSWHAEFEWTRNDTLVIGDGLPETIEAGNYRLLLNSYSVSDLIVSNEPPARSMDASCSTEFTVEPGERTAISVRAEFGADECTVEQVEPDATASPFAGDTIPIWTRSEPLPSGAPCPAALARGRLARHPDSGLGLASPNAGVMPISWPYGYSARASAEGAFLVGASGTVKAREGDIVEAGGGAESPEGAFQVCGSVDVVASSNGHLGISEEEAAAIGRSNVASPGILVSAQFGEFGEFADPGDLPNEPRDRLVWALVFETTVYVECPSGANCPSPYLGRTLVILDYASGDFIMSSTPSPI